MGSPPFTSDGAVSMSGWAAAPWAGRSAAGAGAGGGGGGGGAGVAVGGGGGDGVGGGGETTCPGVGRHGAVNDEGVGVAALAPPTLRSSAAPVTVGRCGSGPSPFVTSISASTRIMALSGMPPPHVPAASQY